jgi:hypothetical protein
LRSGSASVQENKPFVFVSRVLQKRLRGLVANHQGMVDVANVGCDGKGAASHITFEIALKPWQYQDICRRWEQSQLRRDGLVVALEGYDTPKVCLSIRHGTGSLNAWE